MGLNDVMLRVAKQHIDKQPRGMHFSRFQLDRILEALRISVKAQKSKLGPLKRTIRQMIIDYDHLIDIINTKIQ